MDNYIQGKIIIVTGAASGFGKLVSEKASAMGGKLVCADVNEEGVKAVVEGIKKRGYEAAYIKTDVSKKEQMDALAKFAVEEYGRIDVIVNNAGTMPLAYFSDHERAWQAWDKCIDINIKGVVYGVIAVYDQMMKQGQGHIVNISSIYSNFPVVGSAVYQASKIAVRYISESLRQEAKGKIKVSVVRPSGIPGTGLMGTIINQDATLGLMGQNFMEAAMTLQELPGRPDLLDKESIKLYVLEPDSLAESIIYVINQPWGVNIGDITVRSSGEPFIL
jgi:NADP-dependent 3-hydroxy acid dehydrogenase YdfG